LKIRPLARAIGSPPAAGSRSTKPVISTSIPAPVIAEPAKTGCTTHRAVWAASSTRRRPAVTQDSSLTNAANRSSLTSASNSARRAVSGVAMASRSPARSTRVIGAPTTPRRRDSSSSVRSAFAPRRSILLMNISVGTRSRRSARISSRVCG
jgi:hypothetical protein